MTFLFYGACISFSFSPLNALSVQLLQYKKLLLIYTLWYTPSSNCENDKKCPVDFSHKCDFQCPVVSHSLPKKSFSIISFACRDFQSMLVNHSLQKHLVGSLVCDIELVIGHPSLPCHVAFAMEGLQHSVCSFLLVTDCQSRLMMTITRE